MKYFVRIILLLLLPVAVFAQDPFALFIDKSKGLPSNTVYHLLQDSKGFIWMGTDEGLCRYDGFEFKKYTNNQLTSKAGSNIHEDKYGRIWYENFDGYLYYVEHDSLKSFRQNIPNAYLRFGIIGNRIFVAQKNGIDIYRLDNFTLLKTLNLDMSTVVFTQQTKHEFWISDLNLMRLDSNGNTQKYTMPSSAAGNHPSRLVQADDHLFAEAEKGGRWYSVMQDNMVEAFEMRVGPAAQDIVFYDSAFWFCTTRGAYALDRHNGLRNAGRPFFAGKNITCVLKDREQNFWLSTTNEGVLFVPDIRSKKIPLTYRPHMLALDKDNLFVGTDNEELHLLKLSDFSSLQLAGGATNKEIVNLKYDSLNKQVMYTGNGFTMLNTNNVKSFFWSAAMKDIVRVDAKYYAYAASGISGLISLDKTLNSKWDSLVWKNRTNNDSFLNGGLLNGMRGKSVAYNSFNNAIYFATNNGLFVATTSAIREVKWQGRSQYISRLQVYGKTVFGLNAQNKIVEIDVENNIQVSTINDALKNETVRNIKLQGNGIFLFAEKQLFYYDLLRKKLEAVMTDLQYNEASDVVVWKDKVIVASTSGLLLLDFKQGKTVAQKPLFVINDIDINNTRRNIAAGEELKYFENNIAIHYSILCFKANARLPLYYKLNDQAWELCPAETRTLKLASLEPNDYVIQFRLGEHASVLQAIHFRIMKPLWLRTWFLAGVFILVLGAVWIYYKFQTSRLQKRNKLLSEKIELEQSLNSSILTSIKSQMNPHFFYNALNTIQSFIYTGDKKNATNILSKFSKLTRLILEMSNKERISLQEELHALNLYLDIEQARFHNDFEFRISVDELLNKELVKIPSMLIQPYVENAIKRGLLHKDGMKKLEIDFKKERDVLIVSIDDNGIGRKRSGELNKIKQQGHRSFSTSANEKRLEILNRGKENKTVAEIIDKLDAHQKASGTQVILHIPI